MWITIQFLLGSVLGSLIRLLLLSKDSKSEDEILTGRYGIYNYSTSLSAKEIQAVEKFRPMVSEVLERDYENSTQFLIRWIRTSHFDLKSAAEKLRKAQEWKKEIGWDDFPDNVVHPHFVKKKLCEFDGIDNEENPVAYVRLGDVRKILSKGYRKQLSLYLYQCFAKIHNLVNERSSQVGKSNIGSFLIADAQNFNHKQHTCYLCAGFYLEMITDYEKYFPDTMRHTVVVNAPAIAKPIIDIIKPFISKEAQDKIYVFGLDKEDWSSFLLKYISPNQLSNHFGGTRTVDF